MKPPNTRLLLTLLIFVAGCGQAGTPTSATVTTSTATPSSAVAALPPDGEEIFGRTLLDGRPGCITCHALEPDVVLVGPSVVGLVDRAEVASPGDPAAYIRKSIAIPDADVLDGYSAGSMPQASLSDAELDALVDYLLKVGV